MNETNTPRLVTSGLWSDVTQIKNTVWQKVRIPNCSFSHPQRVGAPSIENCGLNGKKVFMLKKVPSSFIPAIIIKIAPS